MEMSITVMDMLMAIMDHDNSNVWKMPLILAISGEIRKYGRERGETGSQTK